MDKKRLHDLTVDNFGHLNLKDPNVTDYNADFYNTETDANKMTGLVVELTKTEVSEDHRQQIGNVENLEKKNRKELFRKFRKKK